MAVWKQTVCTHKIDQINGTNIHPRSTEVQLLERWCPDLVGYGPIPATSRQMIKVTKTSEEVASLSGRWIGNFTFWDSEWLKHWHDPNKHPDPRHTHTHTSKGNNLVLCLLPSEIMWSGLSCSSTICGFCWNTNLTTFLNMRIKKPWITWLQKPVISNPHNHFPRSCATTGWCQNIFGLNAKKPGTLGQHGHMTNAHLALQEAGTGYFLQTKNILQGVAYEVACPFHSGMAGTMGYRICAGMTRKTCKQTIAKNVVSYFAFADDAS